MKSVSLSRDRLLELVARFSECRVAVVGDFFLDKYLEVDPDLAEPSLETGKPAHQVTSVRTSPGAAGTVVSNLAALGAGELHAVGFIGDDGEGYELRRSLEELGCRTADLMMIADRFTPTYLKPRDKNRPGLEGEHSRYDTKNRTPTPQAIEAHVLNSLKNLLPSVEAVVVLDQVVEEDCGVVTTAVREAISQWAAAHPGVLFWADSRRRIRQFRNVVIKSNQFEVLGIDSPAAGDAVALDRLLEEGEKLRWQTNAPVVITRGPEGLLVFEEDCTQIPGLAVEGPIDPTGAGDSTTAGCVLARCAGAGLAEAAIVGMLTASVTIRQLATTGTCRPEELFAPLKEWLSQHGL